MIRTRSRSKDGFRRAGVRHTPEPQEFPNDTFTDEQLEQLQNDPELVVEILDDEKASTSGKGSSSAKKS